RASLVGEPHMKTALAENPRAVLGNNLPPLPERLASDYEELSERIADVLQAARELPAEVETDEQNEAIGNSVKAIRELLREAESKRKAEVEPHLEAQRTTNTFFKSLTDRLSKAKDILEARGRKFLAAKA